MTRKGRCVRVIKGHQVIAECNSLGEAMRLTGVVQQTIRKRMIDRLSTKGYSFKEVPHA